MVVALWSCLSTPAESGHLLKKEVTSSAGIHHSSSINFNGGCLTLAKFPAYCLSGKKKKIMVGKKSPQLFIFICQFLRGFITATKPMLTLELMQQDAKWLQFPWSLCKTKNWPFGEGEGDWCESFNFRLGVFCSRGRTALLCFVLASRFTFAAISPHVGLECSGAVGGSLLPTLLPLLIKILSPS